MRTALQTVLRSTPPAEAVPAWLGDLIEGADSLLPPRLRVPVCWHGTDLVLTFELIASEWDEAERRLRLAEPVTLPACGVRPELALAPGQLTLDGRLMRFRGLPPAVDRELGRAVDEARDADPAVGCALYALELRRLAYQWRRLGGADEARAYTEAVHRAQAQLTVRLCARDEDHRRVLRSLANGGWCRSAAELLSVADAILAS